MKYNPTLDHLIAAIVNFQKGKDRKAMASLDAALERPYFEKDLASLELSQRRAFNIMQLSKKKNKAEMDDMDDDMDDEDESMSKKKKKRKKPASMKKSMSALLESSLSQRPDRPWRKKNYESNSIARFNLAKLK